MNFIKSINLVMLLFTIFGITEVFAQDNGSNNLDSIIKPVESDKTDSWPASVERYPFTSDSLDPNERYPFIKDPWPDYLILYLEKQFIETNWTVERTPLPVPEPQFTWSEAYAYQPRPKDSLITYQIPLNPEERGLKNYQKDSSDLLLNFQYNILEDVYVVVFGDFGGEEQFFDQYLYDRDFPEGIKYTALCSPEYLIDKLDLVASHIGSNFNTINCSDFDGLNVFFLFHPTSTNQHSEAFVIPFKDMRRSRARLLEATLEAQDSLNDATSNEYTTALQIRNLMESLLSN